MMAGYQPIGIGTGTKVNFYQGNTKYVSVSISEANLLNNIIEQHSSCKIIKRLIKNGNAMQVIQVDATSDFDTILKNGVFIHTISNL